MRNHMLNRDDFPFKKLNTEWQRVLGELKKAKEMGRDVSLQELIGSARESKAKKRNKLPVRDEKERNILEQKSDLKTIGSK